MVSERSAKILLVGDRPAQLLALEAILASLNQPLVSVSSAEEALQRLGQEDYAVILLDIQAPGLDGFQTARRIRSHEREGPTPVIFLAADDSPGFSVAE